MTIPFDFDFSVSLNLTFLVQGCTNGRPQYLDQVCEADSPVIMLTVLTVKVEPDYGGVVVVLGQLPGALSLVTADY
jgi:hypothetical protein